MCNICGDAQHDPAASRRAFLKTGAAAALVPLFAGAAIAADPPKPGAPPPPNAIAPADALKRLMDGNARYAANNPTERDFSAGRAARAQAQYPIASILSCSDSRVVPDLVFDQSPGDLFVMRVAGNIVTTDLLASIEYGVQFLGSPLIMVRRPFVVRRGRRGDQGAEDQARSCPAICRSSSLRSSRRSILAEKTKTGTLLDNAIAENVRRQVARLKSRDADRAEGLSRQEDRRSSAACTTSPPARSR